ncbi:ABC transporter ATP-binding protein [Thermaerobacillus caldiproteolyticus]|uniref:ABC transporter ATP-binding protein n=1 Tax=Thermaerobacillus caldiproteolyticus TaxID=247480 RepID=UPI0018F1BA2B|nr:ABC transporter ATP-binding protein [Anoxybacillus caldiproteolyticus]
MSLLTVRHLHISCRNKPIVKNIDFAVRQGEWFTLIGESGSGKSITASTIGGLLPKEMSIAAGHVLFDNKDITHLSNKEFQKLRGKEISYVFQDYQSSLTPFMKIGKQMDEMIQAHCSLTKNERREIALQALEDVQLPAKRVYNSYPFQLSGGQLQRASIAMAIMLNPKLLIADEPTTALDSITAVHVLEVIANIKEKINCAILFITHDLRLARKYSNTIAVMKQGEIVEAGTKESVIYHPSHPYTKRLLGAVPTIKSSTSPAKLDLILQ